MIIVSGTEVLARLTPALLVEAMRKGFVRGGEFPSRAHLAVTDPDHADATLLLMPGWRTGGAMGVKIATVFPGNSTRGLPTVMAQYLLMSAQTGQPRALIDGTTLTLVRTAATSALAGDLMAPPDAAVLAMIGTGALAPHLVRAHCAVRAIASVRIYGRSAAKAEALAELLQTEDINAVACGCVDEAVRDAHIVSCATTSHAPLISAAMLKPGCHVDLVGSFQSDMREVHNDIIAKSAIIVDDLAALQQSGDLAGPLAVGLIDAEAIGTLARLIRSPPIDRGNKAFTLFKSIGTAQADLIAAEALMAMVE